MGLRLRRLRPATSDDTDSDVEVYGRNSSRLSSKRYLEEGKSS